MEVWKFDIDVKLQRLKDVFEWNRVIHRVRQASFNPFYVFQEVFQNLMEKGSNSQLRMVYYSVLSHPICLFHYLNNFFCKTSDGNLLDNFLLVYFHITLFRLKTPSRTCERLSKCCDWSSKRSFFCKSALHTFCLEKSWLIKM